MMLAMIVEAALCVDTGVAESAQDVDMVLILGLGVPLHIGRALCYADHMGLAHVVARCSAVGEYDTLYRPIAHMLKVAQSGQKFLQASAEAP